MKKHRPIQRLLLLAVLTAALLTAVPAAAAFRDTAGHWAEKTLSEWQDEGLIDGCGDGSFRPDGTMTRAEFVKLVNRAMGFTAESAISFSDVTERDWFHAEVARAVAAGYAQGSGGAFRPKQALTRAEAAAMLARAAGLAANEERAGTFADAASIPAWARGSVGAAAEAGCMNGYPDGAFGASDPMTRAEAVVTLDRVRKSMRETVIEQAGTALENETVAGDLIIAEGVGEGNVTLKNVTVLGSVIVRGGGANSVYFDGVRVSGAVRLEKEGVHLRLMGDTALRRVEIGLPCRITQGSTFKGALGALVIDLAEDSAKEIQIEVPAERVELVSRASVSLGADVGELSVGRDAEDAKLEVRRGASVGALNADAKIKLTGSGTVVSLVVSVNGVTVSGTLSVEKTGTTDGAKAPATSGESSSGGSSSGGSGGSSSGGSGGGSTAPVRIVTGAETVADVTVSYGTSEADAMSRFPASVTLNVTEDGKAGALSAAVSWALDRAYDANPRADAVYTATGTVTIPDGYTCDGTLTVTAGLTVKANPNQTVTGISEVTGLELPYGAVESDARLPVQVTVTTQRDDELTANVTWTPDGEWASPGVNTFTGTVSMPAGYYYHGETTATITATVTVMESGVTPGKKLVVNHVPLSTASIGYANTMELVLAAAEPGLPTDLLLQCQDGSYIAVTVPANDWYFTYNYYPNPDIQQEVSLSMDAALPTGYEDDGSTTHVYCSVKIKKLDTAALEGALDEAKAQLDTLTDSQDEAIADSTKIFVAPNGTRPDSVAKGVKFVERSQTAALEDAYDDARSKQNSDTFASQAECDRLARELREAAEAFGEITPNVGTLYTDEMLLEAVRNGGAVNPQYGSFAYSTELQPLKNGSAYPLYIGAWTVDDTTVEIVWEAQGAGAQYVEIKSENDTIGYYERDGIKYGTSHGALITGTPEEPKEVRFVATVKDYYGRVIGKLGENGEYTAIIGAPMRLSDNQPGAPRFASGGGAAGEIYLNLKGAEAIKSVDVGKIGIVGRQGDASRPSDYQINDPKITDGKPSANGLCLTASLSSGQLAQSVHPTGSGTDPAHETGVVTVTIPKEALTLDKSKGWYFPDASLTQEMDIWLCNPQLSVNTQMTTDGDTTRRNISVTAKYIGNAPVQVAYTTSGTVSPPDNGDPRSDSSVLVWVTLLPEQAAQGSDGEKIYSVSNVEGFGSTGTYHIWCRAWEGVAGMWLADGSFEVNDQETQ